MLPHSFLCWWWNSSVGSGGKGHSAMIRGRRCVCVHVWLHWADKCLPQNQAPLWTMDSIKSKQQQQRKKLNMQEFWGNFFFSLYQTKIYVEHTTHVFTALYIKINHFIWLLVQRFMPSARPQWYHNGTRALITTFKFKRSLHRMRLG